MDAVTLNPSASPNALRYAGRKIAIQMGRVLQYERRGVSIHHSFPQGQEQGSALWRCIAVHLLKAVGVVASETPGLLINAYSQALDDCTF